MHTDELLAYSLDKQCRNYRGIHSSRESEQYLFVTYLLAYLAYLLFDKGIGELGICDACH